jgi:hypothetical protein
MAVVVDDHHVSFLAAHLEPAVRTAELRQRSREAVEGDAGFETDGDRTE